MQFCTTLLTLVLAIYGHNLRSETFESTRKNNTDSALAIGSWRWMKIKRTFPIPQRDVHVTCDPMLIKCSRKTPRKNALLSYAQLSKSRKGKKNTTLFVSKLGVDHGSMGVSCAQTPLPSGKILRGAGSVHSLSWELRKKKTL